MKKLLSIFFVLIINIPIFLTTVYGQTTQSFKIDNVMKNNELIEIYEGGIFYGQEGDAIRVAGVGTKGKTITLKVNNNEYSAIVNQFGDWFVLFSITEFKEESYIIEAKSETGESFSITLNIGEDPGLKSEDSSYKNSPIIIIILISLSVILIIVVVLIVIYRKKFRKLFNRKSKLPI